MSEKIEIRIQVDGLDVSLLDKEVKLPDGVTLDGPKVYIQNSAIPGAIGFATISHFFFLELLPGLAMNMAASLLYDILKKKFGKNRPDRIRIDGEQIEFNQVEFERVIITKFGPRKQDNIQTDHAPRNQRPKGKGRKPKK